MTELAQSRIDFIEQLHHRFLIKKGHGAFAYISPSKAIKLFDAFLDSAEPADLFINRFVRSV
jgi:hypothetical protein